MPQEYPPYVPLWCRTAFSFLRGASHPEELMAQARAYRLTQCAITDLDSLAGVVRAAEEPEVRLIAGAEISMEGPEHPHGAPRLLLLACNRRGYGNISELISRGKLRSSRGNSCVSREEVLALQEDTIVLWTWRSGDASYMEPFLPVCRDRLYVGITRRQNGEDHAHEHRLHSLAQRYRLREVALPRVTFHLPERRKLRDVLICIRHGTTLDRAGRLLTPNALEALPSREVAWKLYGDRPELLARTEEVARQCTFTMSDLEYRYPADPEHPGETAVPQELRRLTAEGAQRRYPRGVPRDVARQLDHELQLIEELGYGGYFLTMARIVQFCRDRGILCQGRGSAANSVVCYCLGITAIDPVRMDLLFERFISRERAEPPDIDLDIEHRRREEVIQFVYRRYGRRYAAMVANTVCFRRRSAVREVGGVFGVPEADRERIVRLMGDRGTDVREAIETVMSATGSMDGRRREQFAAMVAQIITIPRHLSIHPGGFLLGRDPICRIVPVERGVMADRTVIQWDKYSLEAMNLFKVDLLGLGALTHLDLAFRLLHQHLGTELSLATIPPSCPRTFAMLHRSETVGVFQLESRAQMAMLPRLRPQCFYDLVVEISLVRPGPITGGMVHPYLRRRAGEEAVTYPHEDLEPILARTLGVPLFQEQVMKLAMVAAGYTPGEADQLRRDMAAWRHTGRIEAHRERITSRMIARGIDEAFARQVFEQIRGFGEYGFPESHAAGFALIAWATAWMRCHYPVVFTCALLNALPMGFYNRSTIVQDARRHGVTVRPLDILHSQWECTLEGRSGMGVSGRGASAREDDGSNGADSGLAIRMGFRFVRDMGYQDWQRLEEARHTTAPPAHGSQRDGWRYLRALVAGAALDRGVAGALARSGAFDSLGMDRREALWDVLESNPPAEGTHEALDEVQEVPQWARLSREERLAWDYHTSGYSTVAHPMEVYRSTLAAQGIPAAAQIVTLPDRARVATVGLVITRQRPETAAGTVFMTLEDETGFVNLVIFPRVFQRLRPVLLTAAFLAVEGALQVTGDVVHLVVRNAWEPRGMGGSSPGASRDFR